MLFFDCSGGETRYNKVLFLCARPWETEPPPGQALSVMVWKEAMGYGAHSSAALNVRHRNALIRSTTLNQDDVSPDEAEAFHAPSPCRREARCAPRGAATPCAHASQASGTRTRSDPA